MPMCPNPLEVLDYPSGSRDDGIKKRLETQTKFICAKNHNCRTCGDNKECPEGIAKHKHLLNF